MRSLHRYTAVAIVVGTMGCRPAPPTDAQAKALLQQEPTIRAAVLVGCGLGTANAVVDSVTVSARGDYVAEEKAWPYKGVAHALCTGEYKAEALRIAYEARVRQNDFKEWRVDPASIHLQPVPPAHQRETALMKSELRKLVVQEEDFYTTNTRYSASLDSVRMPLDPNVELVSLVPDNTKSGAWRATVRWKHDTAIVCAIGVNAANPIMPRGSDGVPVCRTP